MSALPFPVTGKEAERVAKDPKFKAWVTGLISYNFIIDSIQVEAATFVDGKLLFAYLDCAVRDLYGQPVPGKVFLRGDSVAVLVILIDENGEKWTVLVQQARFPTGRYLTEIPAGMIDPVDLHFKGAAARELKEETGIDIGLGQMLWLESVYLSPGGSDEAIGLYFVEMELTRREILAVSSILETTEGEKFKLLVAPLGELPTLASLDAKSMLAYYSYQAASK